MPLDPGFTDMQSLASFFGHVSPGTETVTDLAFIYSV